MRQILIGAIMAGAVLSAGGAWGANPAQGNTAIRSDMEAIGSAYGKLAAQIGDGSKTPSSLVLVDTLIERSKHAQKQVPSGAEKLAGDKREAFVLEYRLAIQGMIDTLGSVKARLSAGDNGAAKRSLHGLKPWTRPAHSEGFK